MDNHSLMLIKTCPEIKTVLPEEDIANLPSC
jgi:hypothetical protein